MRIYRAEKDGVSFYVRPERLQEYLDGGYSLSYEELPDASEPTRGAKALMTAQSVGDPKEVGIDGSNIEAAMAEGLAERVHSTSVQKEER